MDKQLEATLVTPDALFLRETVIAEVFRAKVGGYSPVPDEVLCVNDLIVTTGRQFLARRIGNAGTQDSAMAYMAVGTVTTAATLTDTGLTGEVARKALAVSSTVAGDNVYSAQCTFGGAADSLTGVVLGEASVVNHASSGQGLTYQRVTYSTVTLQASDLLKLTLNTNVGSS